MDMNLMDFPIIDWDQATRLAGKKQFAQEILALLTQELANDITTIKAAYFAKNYPEMLRQVHKLHGAICYCGLPRLKTVLTKLETDLKNNIMEDLPRIVESLDNEAKLLLEHYSLQN